MSEEAKSEEVKEKYSWTFKNVKEQIEQYTYPDPSPSSEGAVLDGAPVDLSLWHSIMTRTEEVTYSDNP